MPKADVLALADFLSMGQADPAALEHAYSRVLLDDAAAGASLLASINLLSVIAGTAVYSWPEEAGRVIGYYQDGKHLDVVPASLMRTLRGDAWSSHVGPRAELVVEDLESYRSFRLYPIPTETSEGFVPLYGEPLGRDYPAGSILLVQSDRAQEIPKWFDLVLACSVLAHEFAVDSDHADPVAGKVYRELGDLIRRWLR